MGICHLGEVILVVPEKRQCLLWLSESLEEACAIDGNLGRGLLQTLLLRYGEPLAVVCFSLFQTTLVPCQVPEGLQSHDVCAPALSSPCFGGILPEDSPCRLGISALLDGKAPTN